MSGLNIKFSLPKIIKRLNWQPGTQEVQKCNKKLACTTVVYSDIITADSFHILFFGPHFLSVDVNRATSYKFKIKTFF